MNELRLSPMAGEIIERDAPVSFEFDGRSYQGFLGDTVSSALWASQCRVLSRSFKYHRRRGDFSFDGTDSNALVQSGFEPNVRAGELKIEPGLAVSPQNVRPSLGWDFLALNGLFHRFLPVGFYYKAFHTRSLWPFYARWIRRMTGLGRVDRNTPEAYYDKAYAYADMVVVGGGVAGMAACLEAAANGARVILIEREPCLGGALRFRGTEDLDSALAAALAALDQQVNEHPNVEVWTDTMVVGAFDDHYLAAVSGNRLYKLRSRATLFATGGFDRFPVFDNNDLPGILTASGAGRLFKLYAVAPGKKILVVSGSDDGGDLAGQLAAAGLDVTLAESRAASDLDQARVGRLHDAGVTALWQTRLEGARGRGGVREALLLEPERGRRRFSCDALVIAAGFWPNHGLFCQAGGRLRYSRHAHQFLPVHIPEGIFVAGRLAGLDRPNAALEAGRQSGRDAALFLGLAAGTGKSRPVDDRPLAPADVVAGRGNTSFRFVDFAEDVTEHDLEYAMAEGYNRPELLKRYATLSMGPDQGRYGGFNSSLMAVERAGREWDSAEVTTSRPPLVSLKMGVLAGRKLEPLRRTPMHQWHGARGCTWLDAGGWKRPDVYTGLDPVESARRVRDGVGLVDVSTLGKLKLVGPDVAEFLSRVYTNKWRKLDPGKVRYGIMCGEDGVILDDGVTARLSETEYYMSLTTAHSQALPRLFRWWQARAWSLDCHLVNLTTQNAAINVAGPRSRELVERLGDPDRLSAEAFPPMSARTLVLAGVECWAFRIGYTGELSYELHFPAGYGDYLWRELMSAGEDLGVLPFGMETLNILRLEKGNVIIGLDTDERSSPVEMGMDALIASEKEYFIGKGALERKRVARDQGGSRRHFVGFQLDDETVTPPDGAIFVRQSSDGAYRKCGSVGSCRWSPHLGRAIGLGWLEGDEAAPGTPIEIRFDGKTVAGRIAKLPFFDPTGSRMKQ